MGHYVFNLSSLAITLKRYEPKLMDAGPSEPVESLPLRFSYGTFNWRKVEFHARMIEIYIAVRDFISEALLRYVVTSL